jgi:peptidoglycan/xylan/chitin deacetylase (PgdA/CDA1 family)
MKILDSFRQHGVMLMYHRVANLEIDPWQLSVSPGHFEEQMSVIQKYGHPVQMHTIGETVHSWHLGRKHIVVTFDDGYADNYQNAKPILERYGVPATFFIVTGIIDSREEFWWDELEQIILSSGELPARFKMTIRQKDYQWPLKPGAVQDLLRDENLANSAPPENGTEMTYGQLYYCLWNILSRLSFAEKKAALRDLARWAAKTTSVRAGQKTMSKKELLDLAGVGLFEIGAHTRHHPNLSYLSVEEQQQEIEESKKTLEGALGLQVKSFSYPHGAYTQDTVALLQRSGFKASCTCEAKPVTKKDDPLLLPRFTVLNWNGDVFEQKLRQWLAGAA